MSTLSNQEIEQQAIAIVGGERNMWEDAVVFVTDKVAFQMRPLIRKLRKNYWGIFDVPKDPNTGRNKIWVPLTEVLTESVVKNIDLDTKDINFRAKKDSAMGLTGLVRSITKNYLDRTGFGEELDDFERRLAIDGTAVWKTIEEKDEDGKYTVRIIPVDLLNIYIDPNARSIKDAYRFTERSLLTQQEVLAHTDWLNTKGIEPSAGLPATDPVYRQQNGTRASKFIDVYEMWGKIPKSLITGIKDDDTIEVDGHLIISGIDRPGKEKVHLVEQNISGKKPYEEAWYVRMPNRWYGKGIAEKVMPLQLWLNTIVNIRVNRSYVQQLGLFKIRKGAGITPQMLARLGANGAIVVNDPQDIEQFEMSEASEASYKDESVIWDWSQKVTAAFDITMGANLPASTPATNASIQNSNSQSTFTLIKESLGMFLQRWVKNQCLPVIFKNIKLNDIIQMAEDDEEIRALDERIVYQNVYDQVKKAHDLKQFIDSDEVHQAIQKGLQNLNKMGKSRFVKLLHSLNVTDYDVEVYVTNEEFDKSVMSNNLVSMLQTLPALAQTGVDTGELTTRVLREVLDLMGLDSSGIRTKPMQQPQMNQNNQQQMSAPSTRPGGNAPTISPPPTQANLMAAGNTLQPGPK